MSTDILYRLMFVVDEQSEGSGFIASASVDKSRHNLPSGDPDSLSEFYRDHASVLALDGWRLVPVQAVRRLATQFDVATFGKGVSP